MADKTDVLKLRITPEEKGDLERQAKAAGQPVSELVREKLFPPKAELSTPRPGDDLDERTAELVTSGMPRHNARILAARERNKAEGAHRIGDLFSQHFNRPRIRTEKERRALLDLK